MRFTIHAATLWYNIRAAMRFVSTDPSRISIGCLRLEQNPERNTLRFISTNGHALWVNEVSLHIPSAEEKRLRKRPESVADVIFGKEKSAVHLVLEDVEKMLKKIDRRAFFYVDVELKEKKLVVSQSTDTRFEVQTHDIMFPPYQDIIPDPAMIPDPKAPKRPTHVDAGYFGAGCDSFHDIQEAANVVEKRKAKDKKPVYLAWYAGKDHSSPTIALSNNAPDALLVIMPAWCDPPPIGQLCQRYRSAS